MLFIYVYHSNIIFTLISRCESLKSGNDVDRHLNVCESKYLRKILGVKWSNKCQNSSGILASSYVHRYPEIKCENIWVLLNETRTSALADMQLSDSM